MTDDATVDRLLRLGLELCANVERDDHGEIVAGQWVNGNGGIVSPETLYAKDQFEREAKAYLEWHKA
jgi:hypothetical protein